MIKTLKEIDILEFLIIYLSLLLFNGFWFFEYALAGAVITVGGLIIILKYDLKFNQKGLVLLCIMTLMVGTSEILSATIYGNGQLTMNGLMILIISILISFLLADTLSTEKLKKNFIICMTIIAVISVLSNLIYSLNASIFSYFPKLINSAGRVGSFAVFSIISDFSRSGAQRNQGIFWEPGAFQFFLCLAYIFELSDIEHKPRKGVLVSLFIAMITTYSTTGVIVAGLLLIYSLIRGRGKSNTIKISLVIVLFIVVFYSIIPRLTGYWEYALIRKIESIFEYQPGISGNVSVTNRIDAIYYPIKELLNSPIIGIGTEGYSKMSKEVGHSIFTCTPINLLVKHGPIYGIIVLSGIWYFIKSNFTTFLDTIIIFAILMLSISSEALQNDIFLLTMCFQGHMYFYKSRHLQYYTCRYNKV